MNIKNAQYAMAQVTCSTLLGLRQAVNGLERIVVRGHAIDVAGKEHWLDLLRSRGTALTGG